MQRLPPRTLVRYLFLFCAGAGICCGFDALFWYSCDRPVAPPPRVAALVLLAGSYQERVGTAARLFRSGYADRILLADDGVRMGWSAEHQRNLFAIERSAEELVRRGVPRSSIVHLPYYRSGTVYDALMAREYLARHGLRSIVLVTSDYHLRRSCWIFHRVLRGRGVAVYPFPAKSTSRSPLLSATESLKYLFYLLRYGLPGVPAPPGSPPV